MDFLGRLRIEWWFQLLAVVGIILIIIGLTIPTFFVPNRDVIGLGFGFFIIGLAEWAQFGEKPMYVGLGSELVKGRKPTKLGVVVESLAIMILVTSIIDLTLYLLAT